MKMKVKLSDCFGQMTPLNSSESHGIEGDFLNECFNLNAQFKRK